MKTITMTKRGIGSIELTATDVGYFYTANGVVSEVNSAEELNNLYVAYKSQGWTVKPEKEVKAPKEPKEPKEKKSREERLTEKYGDIETRREFCKLRDQIRFEVAEEIRQWVKTHHRLTKEQYKECWNKEVQRRLDLRLAEKAAIGG